LNDLHGRDLLQLVADADASIHDSHKHAMYQKNVGVGSFPNLFSQSQSQSFHSDAVSAFSKLNAQMHEIQSSLSRVEGQSRKQWYNKKNTRPLTTEFENRSEVTSSITKKRLQKNLRTIPSGVFTTTHTVSEPDSANNLAGFNLKS